RRSVYEKRVEALEMQLEDVKRERDMRIRELEGVIYQLVKVCSDEQLEKTGLLKDLLKEYEEEVEGLTDKQRKILEKFNIPL
ncbi:MAG: hypothetical protein N3E48_03065, partial [Candidatus Bathyarchaeota archaeon]|nr:hypothetical protein [Candidatus Bathyarchaeota archaeon]